MAKGSVRKKGKKWYARFYIEDESGRKVQKEFVGTESKSETEALLRKAIADYEEKKFVAKSENITVGMLLDLWVEEELKPGNLSNGTVMSYQGTVNRIKQHPIGNRKLKTVTADHLQAYIDFLSFGGTNPDGTTAKALSKGYLRLFSAVLQGAFRFAVFPKRLITFNPMQYVVWRGKKEECELFSDEDRETASTPTLSYEQYQRLEDGKLKLPKAGWIRIRQHRKIREDACLKGASVCLEADGRYYVSLLYFCEEKPVETRNIR